MMQILRWTQRALLEWTVFTSRPACRAAARIVASLAPVSALRRCQRFAVNTFHSNFGVAKLIRGELACPVFHAWAKSAKLSAKARTSRLVTSSRSRLKINSLICLMMELGQNWLEVGSALNFSSRSMASFATVSNGWAEFQ